MFELLQLPAMQLLIPETWMFPGMARTCNVGVDPSTENFCFNRGSVILFKEMQNMGCVSKTGKWDWIGKCGRGWS